MEKIYISLKISLDIYLSKNLSNLHQDIFHQMLDL